MTNNNESLGSCCNCTAENDSVRNIMMLDVRVPEGEKRGGWGCHTCGLEPYGAYVVLCDDCAEKAQRGVVEPKFACLGNPSHNRRIEVEKLTVPWKHNLSRHPEITAALN